MIEIYECCGKYFKTREALERFAEDMAYDTYDDMLDETYGEVEIAGMTYYTSNALKEIDPVAYRCGVYDYESYIISEADTIEIDEDELDDYEFEDE